MRLGRREMLKMLWDSGAQRDKYANDYPPYAIESGSLLGIAAWEGHADMMSDLIAWNKGWSLSQRSHALRLACRAFHGDAVRVLLGAFEYDQAILEGVVVYAVTCENTLDRSCESRKEKMDWQREEGRRQADVIGVLLEAHRGLVAGRPRDHLHLLNQLLPMVATSMFRIDSLRLLLESGADPNHRSENNGMTALQIALIVRRDVGTFNDEGVRLLLDYRASINVLDIAGKIKVDAWRKETQER
jgi:hypothetical protein